MLIEKILVIIGLIVLVVYCRYTIWLNGNKIPESISYTSYIFREEFGITWPFTALCVISAVTLFPMWVGVTPDNYEFLSFISCAGMLFAGSTPLYKQDFEGVIHYTGGATAFVAAVIWLLCMRLYIPIGIIAVVGGVVTLMRPKNFAYVFEVIGYIAVASALLTNF